MTGNADAPAPTWVFVRRVIEYWALLGGLLLIAVVLMNAWSLVRDIIWKQPISGENELVQIGVAIAAFAFLPYCQLTGANVSADIFTSKAGPRTVAVLILFGALIALVCSVILVWRTWDGLLDYRELLESTPIMQFPLWIPYVPNLISLVLLLAAAIITILDAIDDFKARRIRPPTMH